MSFLGLALATTLRLIAGADEADAELVESDGRAYPLGNAKTSGRSLLVENRMAVEPQHDQSVLKMPQKHLVPGKAGLFKVPDANW
jgi:hypothetical protein